jgi:glycosyltransferase involved in cell wall biosynthesis
MALIRRLKPDLIIADETMMAPFAAFSDAKWRVIHTHNHDSVLMGQEVFWGESRDRQLRLARRLARFEERLFPLVEQVWGVKDEDLAAFGKLGIVQDRLFKIPNVVPDVCFEPSPGVRRVSQGVFFGSMWYPPNLEALRRLLEIWPSVRQRLPEARLAVAGRGVPEHLAVKAAAIGGIEILGFVPDLKALLNNAAVAIIPLEYGAGTKIKTIEALAAGVPVLATPVAAEGLGLIDGEHALIRATGPAFSDALVDMLSNPEAWLPMGLRGQLFAKENLSMAALAGAVNQALDALAAQG